MNESNADRNPVELLADEFAARLRRGEHPSLSEYVERYPDLADDIRDLFPALALVERFKPLPLCVDAPLNGAKPPTNGNLPTHLGNYHILRYLGEGGMGVVYEAVREFLSSHVALKVMHPQYRSRSNYLRRFHTEARSAARLHHTNIVSVFDYGEHDGICYYAMQYIAGQSLDKVLDDIRRLRLQKAGVTSGDTVTLSCNMHDGAADGDIVRDDQAPCEPNVPRQSVTLGILTGRFATTEAEETAGEPNTPSASRAGVLPDAAVVNFGATTRQFVSEIREAGARSRAPGVMPSKLGTARDRTRSSDSDTTSSLTGKADIRYYREVARLGAQVADALAYAHTRGVLHRDIKPPNLILDALGNIWVTDFGLAKFEEGDDLSRSQDLVGTLRYMAPERFRGISDRRGDVYALGATLYELLTLRHAFEGKDQLDLIRRIENEPPEPPRQLDRGIPIDLETIVLKALAKDPSHRFSSAQELAAELRRFVENRPIHSRPIPAYQQFWRWCKRNPGLATANIAAGALMTILALVSTFAVFNLREKNRQANFNTLRIQLAEKETREQLLAALQDRARAGRFSRQVGQRFDSLDALSKAAAISKELKLPRDRLDSLRDEAIACLALPDMKPSGRVITNPAGVIWTVFDSAMSRYARRFRDGTIEVRRYSDDEPIARFTASGDRDFFIFEFSPDGRYLATTHYPGQALTVWDVERGTVAINDASPVATHSVEFSPDSRQIAVGHPDRDVCVYELSGGLPRVRLHASAIPKDVAFRADGTEIAVLGDAPTHSICQIFDADTGRLDRPIPLPQGRFESIAWSPDGSTIATPCSDSKIYLWDARTGAGKGLLEGLTGVALRTTFDSSSALIASNGWEGRVRIWDQASGHQWLKLNGGGYEFCRNGRLVVGTEDKLTAYQVDPALEYRTLVHATRSPLEYARVSVHRDGRLMAVGTSEGIVFWDLARGTDLRFLAIGPAWHSTFEPSGDLLTSGSFGVWRWPVKAVDNRSEYRIGPPQQLPLTASICGIDEDRSGQIIALACGSRVELVTPDRRHAVGPLDDCRGVAVSPDGEWLATGTHIASRGVQIWRIRDCTKVADLPIDYGTGVLFSPDGRSLLTNVSPCRIWSVGDWKASRWVGGAAQCFSPDGRQLVVQDADGVLRLVETETGRTLARLESPDLCRGYASFSPDGTRLVVSTSEGPAVHVWDLRAIRRKLAEMGLDWDAPSFSDDNPTGPSALPLGPLQVDYGRLRALIEQRTGHSEDNAIPAEELVVRSTEKLKAHPADPEALHQRGHALLRLGRFDQALTDFSAASGIRPRDAHLLAWQGVCLFNLKRYANALDQFELAFQTDAGMVCGILNLDVTLNNLAWTLATGPVSKRDPALAARLAAFSVALAPGEQVSLNTLGVALYRAGQVAEAIETLEKALHAGKGQLAAFDLYFLAMAHHRLGHRAEARSSYDRAVRWVSEQKGLAAQDRQELADFRAEAEVVLAGPSDQLPANVFANP